VLAFYFARENLQAATESTLRLAGIETATPVTQVMIRERDFTAYDLSEGQDVATVPLAEVRAEMQGITPPFRRLPIRNAAGAVLYVIHDSTLTAYLDTARQASTTPDETIGGLLSLGQFRELVEALGFVAEKATVADARSVMANIKNCNDVFVTASGKRDEPAIGWLTNSLLAGVQ
jgi:hypothetical protein